MEPFSLIVACTQTGGIGMNNGIPWHVPQDMKHFYQITTTKSPLKNAVIMGRKTWDSMQQKPLKNRINVVISSTLTNETGIVLALSLQDALDKLKNVGHIFVIGGASVYQDALAHPMCTTAHVTWIHDHYECDAFFPVELFKHRFEKDGLVIEETPNYTIMKYTRG